MNESGCVKGASSSALQQEMNLARRACWNTSKHTKRKTSTKEDTQCCEIDDDNDDELKNWNGNMKNIRKYLNDDIEQSTDNNKTSIDDHKITTTETSLLYGAKVSENALNLDVNDADTYADPKRENKFSASSIENKSSVNNKNNKNNDNDIIKHKIQIQTQVPKSTTSTIDENYLLIKKNFETSCNNNENHDDNNNNGNDDNDDQQNFEKNTNFRARILSLWLAFVAFCDSVTIKHNDPRFDAYRNCNDKRKTTTTTTDSQTKNKNKGQEQPQTELMTSKYKLLKSKKFLFLFVVCIFFSFLNRIDARPNVSVSSNLITDGTAVDRNGGGGGGETDKLPEVAKLTLAANPTESSAMSAALPVATNVIPKKDVVDSQPAQEEPRHLILSSPDSEEIPHPERYPLSQTDFARVKTPFIIGIWILSASIAKIGFHMTPKLHLIFPESCLLIVVGVAIGVVLYMGTNVAVSPLTPNTFFFYMLPPIILDAGYFMPNRLFFDNLGTILLMAVVGTIFNIATIGGALWACGQGGIFGDQSPKILDIFLFASLISAVDPVAVLAVFEEIHVNEILYIVVFGESLLNDAVTVVMYHMMEVYNEIGISNIIAQDIVSGIGSFFVVAIGGTVIGIIWGVLTGLVTRFTDHVRVIEPIFIFVMAYLAYLNAEIFHMSGILAITFCGITMKNYVESNISQKSHTTVKYALKMLSSSSETIIFMFLGVATVNNSHVWNTWFVILTIVFCSVFRVLGVILLTALANRFRLHKLSRVDQFVMSYGGLRGAVAFALVLLVDERIVKDKNMFVTTTIAVIYFTVFVQGITIKPLVTFLKVKRANKRKPTMNERIHERFMDHLMAGIEDIVGKTGNYNVRDKFKRFDNRFIRPLLIRDLQGAEPKIIETYSKLTMRDAMEVMRRNPSTIGQISGTESMSALFRNYTNNCIGGSPSLTNLDNTCSRNLDMHELDYNPSKKDLTDARIHHLLAEELKPYRRASQQMHRRLSYSRHAVDDRDLSTQVNYKMQMNFRRMFNDRKHHKRSKRGSNKAESNSNVKQNHVSFHDFQQNGSTKQFSHDESQLKSSDANSAAANDDWDDGLTFTAKSSLAEHPIPEEDRNTHGRDSDGERRVSTPTAIESQLPWKRQGDEVIAAVQQNEFPAWASNKEYLAYNSPSATFLGGINKPKQPKSVIGLFRRESSGSKGGGIGGIGGGSLSEASAGSDPALAAALASSINVPLVTAGATHNPRLDKRSQSISAAGESGKSGPFARRNMRRGSMLELTGDTIPEETHPHVYSKSLCEPGDDDDDNGWTVKMRMGPSGVGAAAGSIGAGVMGIRPERTISGSSNTSSDRLLRNGREPLLPRLTPRAQIKRGMSAPGGVKNQVTTALLSTSTNSDYDDDDESEDFDLYDDENIVVTTTTTTDPNCSGNSGGSQNENNSTNNSGAGQSTTTTIRLSRNNDESVI